MYFVDRLNTSDTFIVYINIKYLYMYMFVVLFFLVLLKAVFIALVGELVSKYRFSNWNIGLEMCLVNVPKGFDNVDY